MRDDAAAYHAEACRCRRRRLAALEDRPIPRHPEVHAHADIVGVSFAEPREEVLADGLDGAEGLVVDGRGAFRKAAVRGRAGKLLADEADAVAGRDAVDGVALDHSYLCPEWCRAPGSGSNREQREDVGHEVRRPRRSNQLRALTVLVIARTMTSQRPGRRAQAIVGEE